MRRRVQTTRDSKRRTVIVRKIGTDPLLKVVRFWAKSRKKGYAVKEKPVNRRPKQMLRFFLTPICQRRLLRQLNKTR